MNKLLVIILFPTLITNVTFTKELINQPKIIKELENEKPTTNINTANLDSNLNLEDNSILEEISMSAFIDSLLMSENNMESFFPENSRPNISRSESFMRAFGLKSTEKFRRNSTTGNSGINSRAFQLIRIQNTPYTYPK